MYTEYGQEHELKLSYGLTWLKYDFSVLVFPWVKITCVIIGD